MQRGCPNATGALTWRYQRARTSVLKAPLEEGGPAQGIELTFGGRIASTRDREHSRPGILESRRVSRRSGSLR
eukprot:3467-Pyramimonas_sp.AAC.1